MYKLVSYRNEFFTNRDGKVRYGRFPSSSSPVSRTRNPLIFKGFFLCLPIPYQYDTNTRFFGSRPGAFLFRFGPCCFLPFWLRVFPVTGPAGWLKFGAWENLPISGRLLKVLFSVYIWRETGLVKRNKKICVKRRFMTAPPIKIPSYGRNKIGGCF